MLSLKAIMRNTYAAYALGATALLSSSTVPFSYDEDRTLDPIAFAERVRLVDKANSVISSITNNSYKMISEEWARKYFVNTLSAFLANELSPEPSYYSQQAFNHQVNWLLKNQTSYIYRDLVNYALNDLLATLDPHSSFMTASQYEDHQERMSGIYEGLDIEITTGENDGAPGIVIQNALEDDIFKTGDIVKNIDGQDTNTLDDANNLLRGTAGSNATVTILRNGEEITVTAKRQEIIESPVTSLMLTSNIGYVSLDSFTEQAEKYLTAAFNQMEGSATPPKSYILDLRDNLGGYLNQAAAVSDLFLSEGTIVTTKGQYGEVLRFEAEDDDIINGKPLVVLINGYSASASEITAGALQHFNRATIVGNLSYGKGSVQKFYNFGDSGTLRLTTSLYYVGGVNPIQGYGITPDIKVTFGESALPSNHRETSFSKSILNPDTAHHNQTSSYTCGPSHYPGLLPINFINPENHSMDTDVACAAKFLDDTTNYAIIYPNTQNYAAKELRLGMK